MRGGRVAAQTMATRVVSPLTHATWASCYAGLSLRERGYVGASAYASHLLHALGGAETRLFESVSVHPALANARSGLMALTGEAGGEPLMCPAPIAACADGALLALRALAQKNTELDTLLGANLLTERAALMNLSRNGHIAPGGSCRILDAADGRIAVNLVREDDWAMLPAWLESDAVGGDVDEWEVLAAEIAHHDVRALLERGRLLGLPVAEDALPQEQASWFEIVAEGSPGTRTNKQPMVLDLSSLWAGPLCSHLLQKLGARVIKLESTTRPDGAREGNADFYDLLNAGKQSVALDLSSDSGRAQLRQLIEQADIVIEGSRPRGLRQMGIVAEELVAQRPGLTWLGITGHGRTGEAGEWVGLGDDAGVAGGLGSLMAVATGKPVFVGDAIADPLTGLHAAVAAWHSHINGGGRLISVALSDVVGHCLQFDLPESRTQIRIRQQTWTRMIRSDDIRLPQPRRSVMGAVDLGKDNESVIKEFRL